MRIKFATSIRTVDVDILLVNDAGEQNVCRGLENLNTSECSGRHDTSAMSGLRAPRNSLSFFILNQRVGVGGSPDTEVYIETNGQGETSGHECVCPTT